MRRRWRSLFFSLLALSSLRCVGSDPDPGANPPGQGAQGQPCYANGTCLIGLRCVDTRCVEASATDGASPLRESGAAENDASSEGGPPLPCPPDAILCDGFEGSAADFTAHWASSVDPVDTAPAKVDTAHAHSGARALASIIADNVRTNVSARRRADIQAKSHSVVKAFVYVEELPAANVTLLELVIADTYSGFALELRPDGSVKITLEGLNPSSFNTTPTPPFELAVQTWFSLTADLDLGGGTLSISLEDQNGSKLAAGYTSVDFKAKNGGTAELFLGAKRSALATDSGAAPGSHVWYDDVTYVNR